MLVARWAAAFALLVVLGGCSETKGGSTFVGGDGSNGGDDNAGTGCVLQGIACSGVTDATFNLSCDPTDLTSVVLSGPCATGEAGLSTYVVAGEPYVHIGSLGPGVCHVQLAFSNGFTYSAEVTFVSQTDDSGPGCPPCPSYIAPTQSTFMVNNPSTTCQDAGPDAGGDE